MLLELLLACEGPTSAAPTPVATPASDAPDLVVLLSAGLRADIPDAGPTGAEARFWSAFGAPTVRFTEAYAQSSSTFLSLGSMLTGRYVSSIPLCGLFTDGVSAAETRTVQSNAEQSRLWCADIPAQVPTLPEVLALYGYQTALFSAGLPGTGLMRGFATNEEAPFGRDGTDWAVLGEKVGTWWSEHADHPRLLFVVTADTDVTARPAVLEEMGIRLTLESGFNPAHTDADPDTVSRKYADLAEATGARLHDLAGRLDSKRARWTFVTATNGVSLTEPSGFFGMPVPVATTSYMLDRTARVPLGIFGDALAGTSVRVVELLDLVPTLTRLGGAVPPAGLVGSDLLTGPMSDAETESAYGEFGDSLLYRKGTYTLLFRAYLHHGTVLDPQLDERLLDPSSQRSFSMHEIRNDPYQVRDLVFERPDDFNRMRMEMQRVRREKAAPPAGTWDDPQRLWQIRMARSHGYW